mgnify:CR=1 FL=1
MEILSLKNSSMGNPVKRVLFVNSEITPYLPETDIAKIGRYLPQGIQERKKEIRSFMPRYGCINERRHQLHEVIRLSGMNLIINDDDHQLIIKVSSIPSARIQIYFIDNDDFFSRKAVLTDEEGKEFADNDARMVFYARGVFETVKKLQWKPSVVHCHGWFSAIAPIYLRNMFKDDPLFCDAKIVVALYEEQFVNPLDKALGERLVGEGAPEDTIEKLGTPSYENLMRFVIENVDGVVVGSDKANRELVEYARQCGKQVLDYQSPEEDDFYDNYDRFYEGLF